MKKILKVFGIIFGMLFSIIVLINLYVIFSTKKQILNDSDLKKLKDVDCVLILGAGIWGDNPSPMLQDRLDVGINLYNDNIVPKLLMSGDHGRDEYDEVNIMKDYAIKKGVISENIFMDHAGFSTYDSIYRAKEIFAAKNIIIVTQEYHLYRALHIANSLGMNAYGVNADPRKYSGQVFREVREILARNKDFVKSIFKPKPTYLGEVIPVSSNGDVTNDKEYKFLAKIIEVYDNYIIVEPNKDTRERNSSDKIKINKIKPIYDPYNKLYEVGNTIDITYDGRIMETYPAKINAIKIEIPVIKIKK